MRLGLLALWLTALLPGQRVVVENVATAPQRAWTFVGLPAAVVPTTPGHADNGWPFVPVPASTYGATSQAGGVWLLADLPASTRRVVELQTLALAADTVVRAPSLAFTWAIDPTKLVPRFYAFNADGTDYWWSEPAQPVRVESDAAHQTWHLRTRIREVGLTCDWWARVGSGRSTVEWVTHLTYGDVGGGPISVRLGTVGVETLVEPVVDFRIRVGLPPPAQEPGVWGQTLMLPAAWGRASRVEVRGALLPVDDPARRQRPIGAVFTGWDGSWFAIGAVPKKPPGADAITAGRRAAYLNPKAGNMYDQRPWTQPKASGTTGTQPDFGLVAGEEAVTQLSAWVLDEYRYQCQSYAMRPTGNKELDGSPVLAVNHPRTATTNLRPDDRFSRLDMLGWPIPVPYSWHGSGYSAPDAQHRADNLLHATLALTRDPALASIVRDHIELQKLQYTRPGATGVGAPRAHGRTLLANCGQVWLGFADARPFIDAALRGALTGTWSTIPQDDAHRMRVLQGLDEAKGGWGVPVLDAAGNQMREPNGLPKITKILGPQSWQESIGAGGELAAYRLTGDPQWRALCLMGCEFVTDLCFYRWLDEPFYRHVYCMRWRSEDPGSAHPASSYYPSQPNYDINTDGACSSWSMSAVNILLALEPQHRLAEKARALVGPPRNWDDAKWWAVGR